MTPQVKRETLEQRVINTEIWLKWLLRASSLSLAGILAFAFWLGTINGKVSNTEEIVRRLSGAVSEDSNNLLVRTTVVEHRLNDIEARMTSMESRMSSLESKVTSMETKILSIETKISSIGTKLDILSNYLGVRRRTTAKVKRSVFRKH